MMWRARGIQSVRSPWMRCPITSYGDQVPAPSVACTHFSGKSLSNAVRLAGVRSRIATASSSLNGSSLMEGTLLAEASEAHVQARRISCGRARYDHPLFGPPKCTSSHKKREEDEKR